MKYKKTIFGFVIFLSLVLVGLFINRDLLIQSASFETSQMPKITLPNLEGKTIDVDPSTNELTLITFWMSGCAACKDDLIFLQELATRQDIQGIKIVTISRDEKLEDITKILSLMNLTGAFEVLHDANSKISTQFEVYAVPESFLINKRGMIVKRFVGAVSQEKNSFIREILKMTN